MNLKNRIIIEKIIRALVVTIGLSTFTTKVYAQSNAELISQCLDALAQNDTGAAKNAANTIETMNNIPRFLRSDALECLVTVTEEDWLYIPDASRFVRATEVNALLSELETAKAEEQRQQAERPALLQARKCELLEELTPLRIRLSELRQSEEEAERQLERASLMAKLETVKTCQEWYKSDNFSALTNPVCNGIFTQLGVRPLDTNGGYSRLEISSLEYQITALEQQIGIIQMGSLPEEAVEQAIEEQKRVLISNLPLNLRQQARSMSLGEVQAFVLESERALCE